MTRQTDVHLVALDAGLLVAFVEDLLLVVHLEFVELLLVGAVVLLCRLLIEVVARVHVRSSRVR